MDRVVQLGLHHLGREGPDDRVRSQARVTAAVDIEELAVDLEGYTGADIEGLCREAAMIALRENKKAKKVTMPHFQDAMKAVRPSIDEETMKFYERIGRDLEKGVARRKEEMALGYFR